MPYNDLSNIDGLKWGGGGRGIGGEGGEIRIMKG